MTPNDPPPDTPNARLKKARIEAGYRTAHEFADRLSPPVPHSTYFMHENGKRGLRARVIKRYAAALGVTEQWLALGLSSVANTDHRSGDREGGEVVAMRRVETARKNGGGALAAQRREFIKMMTDIAAARERGYAIAAETMLTPRECAERDAALAEEYLTIVNRKYPPVEPHD